MPRRIVPYVRRGGFAAAGAGLANYAARNPDAIRNLYRAGQQGFRVARGGLQRARRVFAPRGIIGRARRFGAVGGPGGPPNKRQRIIRRVGGVRRPIRFTGKFSGRFKKTSVKSGVKKGRYALRGTRNEREVFGTASMPNVCYIGVQSVELGRMARDVGLALSRHILKKHFDIDLVAPDQTFWDLDMADKVAAIAYYYEENPVANTTPILGVNPAAAYNFSAASTLNDMADHFAVNVFLAADYGGGNSAVAQRRILKAYSIFRRINVGVDPGVNVEGPRFYLDHQYVKVYSTANLNLQNVTSADVATGDPLDSSRIDANPICGRVFKFKGMHPLVNDATHLEGAGGTNTFFQLQMSDQNNDGVLIPAIAPVGNWRGIPTPDVFKNCISSGHVTLDPGQIKKETIMFKYDGLLHKLITGFANHSGVGTGVVTNPYNKMQNMGTCLVFAFEKRMRTGVSQNVAVNYHVDWYQGAVLGGKSKVTLQKNFVHPSAAVDVIL